MFLSSGDGYVRELLELPQGCQGTFRGSRGKVGFLSRHRSRKWPHLTLRGESPAFLELRQETWGPSRVTMGTSGTRSCCLRKVQFPASYEGPLWIPLQSIPGPRSSSGLRREPQGSSTVLTWTSGFLWSFHRGVRPRLVWKHACPLSSRAGKAASGFSRVDIGICGYPSRCHRAIFTV